MAVQIAPPPVGTVVDLWPRPAPRLVAVEPLPPAPREPEPAPLPAWDAAQYAARQAAYDQFRATLRPLLLAVATAMSDRYPASLAHRSLPRGEQAFDDTLAAWQQFRAACEGRVR